MIGIPEVQRERGETGGLTGDRFGSVICGIDVASGWSGRWLSAGVRRAAAAAAAAAAAVAGPAQGPVKGRPMGCANGLFSF